MGGKLRLNKTGKSQKQTYCISSELTFAGICTANVNLEYFWIVLCGIVVFSRRGQRSTGRCRRLVAVRSRFIPDLDELELPIFLLGCDSDRRSELPRVDGRGKLDSWSLRSA